MPFFYVQNKVRYLREPDDIPMMEDEYVEPFNPPEPDELERQEREDLRLALLEIGYTPALMRKQVG